MKKVIPIFKISTFVSFIFIFIPNEKSFITMIGGLLALLIGYGGILWMIISALVLATAVFIFINAFTFSKLNYQLSALSILILYVPVGITIAGADTNLNFMSAFSYLTLIIISLITLGLIIRRLVQIKNVA